MNEIDLNAILRIPFTICFLWSATFLRQRKVRWLVLVLQSMSVAMYIAGSARLQWIDQPGVRIALKLVSCTLAAITLFILWRGSKTIRAKVDADAARET